MESNQRSSTSCLTDYSAAGLILLTTVLIVWHALGRQYLNVNTETDFIGSFQIEAARFLAGQPLDLAFHPPGYPIVLAATYFIVNDWFVAGLAISAASAFIVLLTSYLCFRELIGHTAGLGALCALLGSSVFFFLQCPEYQ